MGCLGLKESRIRLKTSFVLEEERLGRREGGREGM